ncbi:MAG: quinolinate synthase subunit A [Actinobacteria bacterium]|nr:quinolinate synthase subunit A [Actinomycetota bacterium]
MSSSLAQLLLLGANSDLSSERGVSCTGELPPASDPNLVDRAKRARSALGERAMVLGHHYQRDEVIEFADITGDSFKLAQSAADNRGAELIIFCGVHFMAESADILTAEIPVTYMNSSAAIKSFTGENGGTICTSSNAERAMRWAFDQGQKVFFLPDQHLGRNTAVLKLGLSLDECVVWNPWKPRGGLTDEAILKAKVILWRGHCSVHGRFSIDNIEEMRKRIPGVNILVHPECQHDVVKNADYVGSTESIIKTVSAAPAGSAWAVGTELNLVKRLAANNPDKKVVFLDKTVCYCSTMNRIDLPHLVWAMETLVEGRIINQIKVDEKTSHFARVALERMLALP